MMPYRRFGAAYAALAICVGATSFVALRAGAQSTSRESAAKTPARTASATATPEARARFERVQQRYRSAKSFRITFDQTLSNPITGGSSTSRGELVSQRPNKFAITFRQPVSGDEIVCDGQWVWVYLPSSVPGQVIKFSAAGARGATADPIGRILTAPADQYRLADAGQGTVAGHATHAVTLTPTTSEQFFTTATVWIDDADGSVRRIDVTETSGVSRQLVITKQATNVSIAPGTFTFTPPTKVRVIEQGAPGR